MGFYVRMPTPIFFFTNLHLPLKMSLSRHELDLFEAIQNNDVEGVGLLFRPGQG